MLRGLGGDGVCLDLRAMGRALACARTWCGLGNLFEFNQLVDYRLVPFTPLPFWFLHGKVGLSCHDKEGKPLLSKAFDLDPAAAARMKQLGINSTTATDYFWKQVCGGLPS